MKTNIIFKRLRDGGEIKSIRANHFWLGINYRHQDGDPDWPDECPVSLKIFNRYRNIPWNRLYSNVVFGTKVVLQNDPIFARIHEITGKPIYNLFFKLRDFKESDTKLTQFELINQPNKAFIASRNGGKTFISPIGFKGIQNLFDRIVRAKTGLKSGSLISTDPSELLVPIQVTSNRLNVICPVSCFSIKNAEALEFDLFSSRKQLFEWMRQRLHPWMKPQADH